MKDSDMFRSANDDCSKAKRTERFLLCDGDEEEQEKIPDGSCDIHFQTCIVDLHSLLKHALQEVLKSIVGILFKIHGCLARECQNSFVIGKTRGVKHVKR